MSGRAEPSREELATALVKRVISIEDNAVRDLTVRFNRPGAVQPASGNVAEVHTGKMAGNGNGALGAGAVCVLRLVNRHHNFNVHFSMQCGIEE